MSKNISFQLLFLCGLHCFAQEIFQQTFYKMGSDFELTIVADNQKDAHEIFAVSSAEIDRIEQLISSWNPSSETSQVAAMAGIRPVQVSNELIGLVERSCYISKLTGGAFDISYAAIDGLWEFDGGTMNAPSAKQIEASIAKIGYEHIEIDPIAQTLFLQLPDMKMGFGAIGKGYAADRVKALLIEKGISGGIINAAGDMSAWGKQPDGTPWKVAVVNPMDKRKVFAWFSLQDNAVVTSGDYERFVIINGKRYGHIINPKTGFPSEGVVSCSVFAPKAELADALATALFVMGVEVGINFINQLPQVEALMIDEQGKIFTSTNIDLDETI